MDLHWNPCTLSNREFETRVLIFFSCRNLSLYESMVLRAVLSEFKRTGVEETKFGDVSIDVIEMILLCKKEKENKVERE